MKRTRMFLIVFGVLMAFASLFIPGSTLAELSEKTVHKEPDRCNLVIEESRLPGSLYSIGDSAFEGTAIEKLNLSRSVEVVGNRAFAEMSRLTYLYMPSTLREIGDDILSGSMNVKISSARNSMADEWANRHGIPFVPIMTFTAGTGQQSLSVQEERKSRTPSTGISAAVTDASASNSREHRTGRTIGELKSAHFKGIAAQHIQSRYFP